MRNLEIEKEMYRRAVELIEKLSVFILLVIAVAFIIGDYARKKVM